MALLRDSVTCLLAAQSHVLQVGMDGRDDLADVDPDHCALRLSEGTCVLVWGLDWGEHEVRHECPLSPRSLKATHTGNRLHIRPRRALFAAVAHRAPWGKSTFGLIGCR